MIDPDEMKIQRTICVETDPYDIAVTDDGFLYVSSTTSQWTDTITVMDMKQSMAIAARWNGHGIGSRQQVCLSPDQKRMYLCHDQQYAGTITSCVLPERAGDEPKVIGELRNGQNKPVGGLIFVTPDEGFVLTLQGGVFVLTGSGKPRTEEKDDPRKPRLSASSSRRTAPTSDRTRASWPPNG